MIGLWLALSATPAFADSMTVYDEDRWRGNTTWPTATVMDTAAGDIVELSEEPGRLTINAQTRPEYGYFSVQFEGPGVAGRLEKGVYPAAQRTYQRHKDRPGIGYSASSYYGFSYCKIFRGSFEVLDLVRDSSDRITGAWIVWEQHCEGEIDVLRRGPRRASRTLPARAPCPLTCGSRRLSRAGTA